ncbi:hypothetical protein D6D01_09067 [Aureobasidium pullulans]|uniref:Uncharacterized protein n=1 Tax=Aureobasidium pullulans TaxID=5580 RepID=A0A4S9K6I3_AURPU|nr:hypothetical protein D6D01_09067 [Aureobasidium pullulans]
MRFSDKYLVITLLFVTILSNMENAINNFLSISKDTTMDTTMDNNMDTTMGDSEAINNTIDGMGKAGSDARPPVYGVGSAECGAGKSTLINAMTTNLEPKSPNITTPTSSPPSEKKTSPLANSISKTSKPIGIIKKIRPATHTSPITKPTTKSGAHSAPVVSTTSPFMRLPANLRNKILLEALEPAANTNPFVGTSTSRNSSSSIDTITSLLSLNRKIRTQIQTLMIAKAKTASECKNTDEEDEVKVQTEEDDGKVKQEMEEMTNMLREKLDLHAEMGGDNAEFEGLVAEAMKE